MVEEALIVKIVDALIRRAVDEGASDIHLERRRGCACACALTGFA